MKSSSRGRPARKGGLPGGWKIERRRPLVPLFPTSFGLRFEMTVRSPETVLGLRVKIGRREVWIPRLGSSREARFLASIPTGPGWKAARVEAVFRGGSVRVARFLFYRYRMPGRSRSGDYPTSREAWNSEVRNEVKARIEEIREPPSFSVLTPVFNPKPAHLREAIQSMRSQEYPLWELILADDGSDREGVAETLDRAERDDARIRVLRGSENLHISRNSNRAAEIASHAWLSLLDHDDRLTPDALARFAFALDRQPRMRFLYADEDKIGSDGRRRGPYYKPGFNRVLLESQNYVCHPAAFHSEDFSKVGGFRTGFEGAQDWDLFLRLTAGLPREHIHRVPRVLYHWREHADSTAGCLDAKPYAMEAARRAVVDARRCRGLPEAVNLVQGMYFEPAEPMDGVAADPFLPGDLPDRRTGWIRFGGDGLPEEFLQQLERRLARFALDASIGVLGFRCDAPEAIADCGIAAHPQAGLVRLFAGADRLEPGMGCRAVLPQEIGAVAGRVVFFRAELIEDLQRWLEATSRRDTALCGLCRSAWRKGLAVVLDAATVVAQDELVQSGITPEDEQILRDFDPEWFLDDPAFHPGLEPVSGPLKPARF